MRKVFRENGLSIVVFALFLLFVVGQFFSGFAVYNQEQQDHNSPTVTVVEYVATGHFWGALFENWESEFLQMGLFVLLSVKLRQKGSTESKKLEGEEEVDKEETGNKRRFAHNPLLRKLYKNSLSIAFFFLFFLSFILHGIMSGIEEENEQREHHQPVHSAIAYFYSPKMWFQSFQNWQSEFLAIGSIVVLTIFLRQKGSPQSKPVDAPDDQTGG